MKLLNCVAENFGSYRYLEIDFSDMGLSLMYGKTGSGKSTVPDIAAWALFGQTAKNGSADEVRSWAYPDEPTSVNLGVSLPDGNINVVRVRGKPKENDLFWFEESSPETTIRGKDITDTQRKLEKRLGLDVDTFVSGSYFHEFSASGSFFTAKSKDRREIFEKIANLELPARLAVASSEERKLVKQEIAKVQSLVDKTTGKLSQLEATYKRATESEKSWGIKQEDKIKSLTFKINSFEKDKEEKIGFLQSKHNQFIKDLNEKIDNLKKDLQSISRLVQPQSVIDERLNYLSGLLREEKKKTCPTCGGPKNVKDCNNISSEINELSRLKVENTGNISRLNDIKIHIERLSSSESPYLSQIDDAEALENHYSEQLKEAEKELNPFVDQINSLCNDIVLEDNNLKTYQDDLENHQKDFSALDILYDLSSELRGELLKRTVKGIESETNRYLERYFDAEILVQFDSQGDDLNVSIQKSGYECSYKQLSKGQRGLLRLCFCVSIMQAVSNRTGIHFDNLFFDESLDGLDSELKVKAFDLFSELETKHKSVLLVDHAPEFQSLFSRRYHVAMISDCSEITLESQD